MSKEKLQKYEKAFTLLMNSSYRGVPGISALTGKEEGPTLAVLLCTHGNEPVGLETFLYFYDFFQKHPLTRGTVLFILSNPSAVKNYLSAEGEEPFASRFVHINMNRLPGHSHEGTSSLSEVQRLQEIYPILCEVSIAIDLHSTSLPSQPMVIALTSTSKELLARLPVRDVIGKVNQVMGDIFLLSYVGGFCSPQVETVAIECGQHEDPRAVEHALHSVFAIMEYCNLGMYDLPKVPEKHYYPMETQIFFPHESYQLVRDFGNFEPIAKGQLLAQGNGPDILAPHAGHALFAFKGGKVPSIKEEALFLTGERRMV